MPKWPSDSEESAIRGIVALGDSINISGADLLSLYLDVEAILQHHDVNPRKLLDAMNYLEKYGND